MDAGNAGLPADPEVVSDLRAKIEGLVLPRDRGELSRWPRRAEQGD
jgi:hypothetical protein